MFQVELSVLFRKKKKKEKKKRKKKKEKKEEEAIHMYNRSCLLLFCFRGFLSLSVVLVFCLDWTVHPTPTRAD